MKKVVGLEEGWKMVVGVEEVWKEFVVLVESWKIYRIGRRLGGGCSVGRRL